MKPIFCIDNIFNNQNLRKIVFKPSYTSLEQIIGNYYICLKKMNWPILSNIDLEILMFSAEMRDTR